VDGGQGSKAVEEKKED